MKNGAKLLDESKTLVAKKKEAKLRAASEFGIFRESIPQQHHNNEGDPLALGLHPRLRSIYVYPF